MKERPILFSAPMVRALLDGTKTQTRRIVKPQPPEGTTRFARIALMPPRAGGQAIEWRPTSDAGWSAVVACPYGEQGDRLWVRETWATPGKLILYRADFSDVEAAGLQGLYDFKWRPSIFMRPLISRITLGVTAVRAERLQAITIADAMAEGMPQTAGEAHRLGLIDLSSTPGHEYDNRTSAENYARGWDSINGKRAAWATNPWVWVVSFRRVEVKR